MARAFEECAFGSYRPDRFLARFRSEIWSALKTVKPFSNTAELERSTIEKYSTYLHETIHWWQCIGTTYGLILSLTSATKTHITRPWIQRLITTMPARKPLKDLAAQRDHPLNSEQREYLNIILNHWHDLEFNARITLRRSTDGRAIDEVIANPYFHSIGHSLHVALADTMWMLASTFDQQSGFIPDSREWESAFSDLEQREVEGYYRGSPVVFPQIGAQDIFEGQARFSQLQYLYLSSQHRLSWNDLGSRGLLRSDYTKAFRFYLEAVGSSWPGSPTSSEVNLFLLLCDLALNPGDGYPFRLLDPESLTITNDPGMRFAFFCRQIAKHPRLLKVIQRCSHEEYLEVSMLLSQSMGCRTPVEICAEIVGWLAASDELENLLREEQTFSFPNENLVVRVCFAKHLRFLEDKLSWPHFYCWSATFLVEPWNDLDFETVDKLLTPHLPLFVGSGDEEVKLAISDRTISDNATQTLNDFYRWVIQYDLADQWMSKEGPFDLDFTDLHPELTAQTVMTFAGPDFLDLWGVRLERILR